MKTQSAHMKAVFVFEFREVTLPDTPPPGQVLLRVDACGVCGSDLTAAHSAEQWKPFGHEVAGTILRLGAGVEHLAEQQRIVLESGTFCGRCDLCRNGRVDLCNKGPHFWKEPAMGFSQYMLAPAAACVPYANLDPAIACLAEPGGVAYDMVKVADVRLGDRVCLIGPGPIGLMAAALARSSGAVRVAVVGHSHSTARLALARQLGCEPITQDGSLADRKDLHRQFDHVLLTAPCRHIPDALALLAYEGKLTYIGIGTGPGTISFDANDFHFRKLQLRSSFASPATYLPRVLALLQSGILPGEALVSHRLPLDRIADAMNIAQNDKTSALKVVVTPPANG